MRIDLVLASYNGEAFIEQQIRSIQACTGYQQHIARFIVVDDGSTDSTHAVVTNLQQHDSKIEWHNNTSGQHGAMANFEFGLRLTTADWVMLSDQDDIWHPSKIAEQVAACTERTCHIQIEEPLLCFSDKTIVDEKRNPICASYFELKRIPKNWHHSLSQLAMQNVASGCTAMFNRRLLELALPIPQTAYMHDWWLVLVAKQFGQVLFVDKPLIEYRQHSHNTIGANKHTTTQQLKKLSAYLDKFTQSFWATVRQAQQLVKLCQKQNIEPPHTLLTLATFGEQPKLKQAQLLLQKKITRSSLKARLALWLMVTKG